jgi:hypothetical protein
LRGRRYGVGELGPGAVYQLAGGVVTKDDVGVGKIVGSAVSNVWLLSG